MKHCKDCKHARPFRALPGISEPDYLLGKCAADLNETAVAVAGYNEKTTGRFLTHARSVGRCGPDGKLWEPK